MLMCTASIIKPPLVGGEHGLGDAPGLEQAEAQQHRIAHTAPYRPGNVGGEGDALHQDGVDARHHHYQERLEAQGEQGFQVALPHAPPLAVADGGEGDRIFQTPVGNGCSSVRGMGTTISPWGGGVGAGASFTLGGLPRRWGGDVLGLLKISHLQRTKKTGIFRCPFSCRV